MQLFQLLKHLRFFVILILILGILHEEAIPQKRSRRYVRNNGSAQTTVTVRDQFKRAVQHYKAGRYYSALDAFRRLSSYTPEENPQLSASLLMTMKSYYRVGKYDQAAKVGRSFLERFPGSTYQDDVFAVFGDISAAQHWYISAAKHWLTARSTTKDSILQKRTDEKLWQLASGFLTQEEIESLLMTESNPTNRSILNLMMAGGQLRHGDPDGTALILFRLGRESLPLFYDPFYDNFRKQTYEQSQRMTIVGVVTPLSGPSAPEGFAFLKGIQEAVNRFSSNSTYTLALEIADNEGDELKTIECIKTLSANPNVLAILGPLSSSSAIMAASAATNMKIPLLLPTASRTGLANVGNHVIQLNSSLFQQGRYAAEYAIGELGLTTVAVVAPRDKFGKELTDGFLQQADALGAEVVSVEWYTGIPLDIGVQLRSLRDIAFELAVPDTQIHFEGVVLDTVDSTFILAETDFYPEEEKFEDEEEIDSTKIVLSSIDAVYLPIHTGDIQFIASQFAAHLLEAQLIGNGSWYDPFEMREDLISGNVEGMIVISNLVEPEHANSQEMLSFSPNDFTSRREFLMALAGYDTIEFLWMNLGNSPTRADLITAFEKSQFYRGVTRIHSYAKQSPHVNSACSVLQYHQGNFITVAEIINDTLALSKPSPP